MLLKKVVPFPRKYCVRNPLVSCFRALSKFESDTIRNGILYSDSEDIVIPSTNLTKLIFEKIRPSYKYKAIECGISGKAYTYEDLRAHSRNLSKFLRGKLKLQHGDVVAIVLPNRPEFAVACLGILEAGLTVTAINPLYTRGEMEKQLTGSGAKAIITQVTTYSTVLSAIQMKEKNCSQIPLILVKDKQNDSIYRDTIDFEEITANVVDGPDIPPATPNDIAFLPFSSGTTGLPKSIQLTHGNLVSAILQQCHPDLEFSEPPSDSHQDVLAAILPFFHIFGFATCLLIGIVRQVKLVTQPKFMPDKFVELLRDHKTTYLFATPPLVLFLISNDAVKSEYLKDLKYFLSGAAPLGELDEERLLCKVGKQLNLFQGYGMSETSMIALTATKQLQNIRTGGSVGKPIPNTKAKVIDTQNMTASPLGPHEVGEILVKGPQVTIGYGNAPGENDKAFVDGWLRTGDVGYYDERGCIFIKDRAKELIKVKGYQVAPAELEALIRNFPTVEDAGVIGIPHPIFGEVPRAYVVPKSNTTLDVRKFEEYVNANVVKYKRLLGGVEIIDAIPKNASGKILRRELKQRFLLSNVKS